MKKKKPIAAILCRVSTQIQSWESQAEALTKDAERFGFVVPSDYIFHEKITGMDAIDKDERQSLQDLKTAIKENGDIEAVFMWEITRLSRSPYFLVDKLKEFNYSLKMPIYFHDLERWTINPQTHEVDTETENKIFGAAMFGKQEWEKIRQRTMRGRQAVAEKGFYVGHLSDGYKVRLDSEGNKVIAIDDDRKDVIIEIFNLFIEGNSTDRISQILNAKNIPTTNSYRATSPKFGHLATYKKKHSDVTYARTDSKWSGSLIANIIRNTWYVGERTYNGETYQIPPIITEDVWDKALTIANARSQNFRSNKSSKKHTYLLGNKIFCGKCGRKFYGHYTGLNNHYYCSSIEEGEACGGAGINKENIEAIIFALIREHCYSDVYRSVKTQFRDAEIEESPFLDFFKQSKASIDSIKETIKVNKQIIANAIKEMEGIEDLLPTYNEQLAIALAAKDKLGIKSWQASIEKKKVEYSTLEGRVSALSIENSKLESQQRKGNSVKAMLDEIEKMADKKDLSIINSLFDDVVDNVVYYNADVSVNVFVVTYTNREKDVVLYAPRLLQTNFVLCHNMYYDIEQNVLRPDVSQGHYLCIDTEYGQCKETTNDYDWVGDEAYRRGYFSEEQFANWRDATWDENPNRITNKDELYKSFGLDEFLEHETINDWFIMAENDSVSPRDFIQYLRGTQSILIRSYERLEELSEKGKQQKAKYKEWRKKYNTGKPTSTPWVVKDADYETICAERKRLYNKIYKIKNRKTLEAEEKERLIAEIKEKLVVLGSQVKFIDKDKR